MSYDRSNEDYTARVASDAAAGFPIPAKPTRGELEARIMRVETDRAHWYNEAQTLRARVDILEAPIKERERKRGEYWLTDEGRREVRETWEDEIPPHSIPPVYLAHIEKLEAELASLRQQLQEAHATIERLQKQIEHMEPQ